MAAETTAPPAAQSANGTAPGTVIEEPCEDCANPSERIMGLLGIGAALALAFIGVDLLTGGQLSRVLFGRGDDAAG